MRGVAIFPSHTSDPSVAAFNFAGKPQIAVEHRDKSCGMRTRHIDYAHHAVLVDNTHFRPHAVGLAAVNGYEVVAAGNELLITWAMMKRY